MPFPETTVSASKKHLTITLAVLGLTAGGAQATEYGTVMTTTPRLAAVPVAQRVCSNEPVVTQQAPSGAGALVGAIVGAALGNRVGGGAGRAAATGIGLVVGSEIGNRAEADALPPVANTVQRCRTVTRYDSRVVGYDVEYEYQGVLRRTFVSQDPGERIALDVKVAPVGELAAPSVATGPVQAAPVVQAPLPEEGVVYEQARPRVVYTQPNGYYGPQWAVNPWLPLALGFSLGWQSGGWGGGHGHWRGR